MQEDDENQFDIGNQDHFDHAPDEFKDHLMQAFIHAAGKGKHPGKYAGRQPEPPPDDAITEGDLQRVHEGEASAAKMHAAQTGAPEAAAQSLAPSQMDQAAIKQRSSLQQQAATQGAQAAAQAQGAQAPVNAPPAPAGPQGATIPFSTQKGAVGGPGNVQQPSQAPPPAAPGPGGPPPEEGEEEGPPQ